LQIDFPGTSQVALEGMEQAGDGAIWDYAKSNGFVIVSKDSERPVGSRHSAPRAEVRGILIFLHERDDPGRPHGVASPEGPFRAVYLNRFLPELLAREPDNPYVAVFAPLVIERDEALKAQAPALWQTIQSAPLTASVRQNLSERLEFWFFERFRDLTAEEIWTMLNQLTPLEETRAYQSSFAKGETTGEAKGEVKGKSESLQRLLHRRFGSLRDWATARIAAVPAEQLDTWLDAVLDVQNLEVLIGPAPSDADIERPS
jgi:hypothetical protein